MLSRQELKEIASVESKGGLFVSLYLNVDPISNNRGDYAVHFKNMMKNKTDSLDKAVYKLVREDMEKISNYVLASRKSFKKGLAVLSSAQNSFWKEYNVSVPLRNELVVDKTPYTKQLLDIMDNYQRHAVLLVDKESARIFIVYLGEIVEYGEVHTQDIPGKHKKGGWFALSQNHYDRHVDYHVGMHLKDVVEKLESFLNKEYIGRFIIGGSDEAVSMVKGMLHKTILDKLIGSVKIEMFAKPDEVLRKLEPVISAYEKKIEDETVDTLIAKALKNENAVLGLDNVINALQEQKVMKLVVLKDYRVNGHACAACTFLTVEKVDSCPYCKSEAESVDYLVDLACEKAIQQGAHVEVVTESKKLMDAGGIGAFLRF